MLKYAAGEGGNDEDRADRRDPVEARPRASRRHIPRPHHGGRRARRARQFPGLVRPDGRRFNSPRHRHNFEQIRYQLEGVLDYGRDGKLTAGMVGYFPEAVYYGPQSQDPSISCKTIVLQFGGASGSGYLSQAEVQAGM